MAQKAGTSFGWLYRESQSLLESGTAEHSHGPSAPGLRQLHQPGELWFHKWGQTGQGHRDIPAPCHFTQMHSLSMQLRSHGGALVAPVARTSPSLAGTAAKPLCIYVKISI